MNDDHDELLISLAVDGRATAGDWEELASSAGADPDLWRRLGETLRDQAGFARAINSSVAVADTVDPPIDQAPEPAVLDDAEAADGLRILPWLGWAVAATLTISWAVDWGRARPAGGDDWNTQVVEATAGDLLQAYLKKGRQEKMVIGEVPERILIDSRSMPSGEGYELLYLRQILERAIVPDLYQFTAQDELGRPTLVRFEQPAGPSM
ncbi:MAG: hypothetical protein O6941_02695 [Planctomycetota bacterium]|nr:hypothetical protein [Planctomycetota bacterium]